jgi:intracellular septation protein
MRQGFPEHAEYRKRTATWSRRRGSRFLGCSAASRHPLEAQLAEPLAPAAAAPTVHPLIHAGKWLLADLLSTLVFLVLYEATGSLYLAVGVGIALGIGQMAYLRLRGAAIDRMQWLSLGLVIVFGGAALVTHNPRFIMIKPTLIYCIVGGAMLMPGWMNRYMTPIARTWGGDVTFVFGYVWAALMFATALGNLGFALVARPALWAWYLAVFPLASKVALVGIQYVVTRTIVRARIRTGRGLAAA